MNPENFKLIRLEKGLTQKGYAEYLGLSPSTVVAIETGKRQISDHVRACLAKKVEIDDESINFFDSFNNFKT